MREEPLAKFGLLTVEAAAELRGVTARTVQRWIESGGIAVVPVGKEGDRNRKYLVITDEVKAYQPAEAGRPKKDKPAKQKGRRK